MGSDIDIGISFVDDECWQDTEKIRSILGSCDVIDIANTTEPLTSDIVQKGVRLK
jgi:hypothetical protein